MNDNRGTCRRGGYLLAALLVGSPAAGATATDNFKLLVPPINGGEVAAVQGYRDSAGHLAIAYQQSYPDRPSEFFSSARVGQSWAAPVLIVPPSPNQQTLHAVVNLSTGTPLLLMSADTTDYAEVFDLGAAPTSSNDSAIVPGLSNEQLGALLENGQRLMYSLQVNGAWVNPIPIPETFRALRPAIATGDDGTALVVFSKDADKNSETANDIDLYFTLYRNNLWTKPARLTGNGKADYAVQVQYFSGQYVIAWVTDEDSDFATAGDKKIYYARIASSDSLTQSPSLVTSAPQYNPTPLLGRSNDTLFLLWASSAESDKDPRRRIWESRFNGSWTAPGDTGLSCFQFSKGRMYETPRGTLAVYQDGGAISTAARGAQGWGSTGPIDRLLERELKVSEASYLPDTDGSLWLLASGHIAAVATSEGEPGDGLYYRRQSIGPDLTFRSVVTEPFVKRIGQTATLRVTVGNRGQLPSAPYALAIESGAETIARLEGAALKPGGEQQFEHPFKIMGATTPLTLRIATEGDQNEGNNQLPYPVRVEPDYAVRSVKRVDATHYEADLRENKGIAATPAKVEFFLVSGGQRSLLTSGQFDPNSGAPMTVQTDATAALTGPYQILVTINADRSVGEDDFSNNQAAYNFHPQVDFAFSQAYLASDGLHLLIRNNGEKSAASVDLLITDDPLLTGQGRADTNLTPWYYRTLALDAAASARVDIGLSQLPPLDGRALYAVLNPYGQSRESDRNNNQAKVLLTQPAGAGGGSGGAGAGPHLIIADLHPWCANVQAFVRNDGNAAAIGPEIRLAGASGLPEAATTLPVLPAGGSETVSFPGLRDGEYTFTALYATPDGLQRTSQTVTVAAGPQCEGAADNDVAIAGVVAEPAETAGDLLVRITLSAQGYPTHYRKPLVRVPFTVELKEGVRTLYSEKQVAYLAGAGEQDELLVPIPDGAGDGRKVVVRLAERDDEKSVSNNGVTVTVSAEGM